MAESWFVNIFLAVQCYCFSPNTLYSQLIAFWLYIILVVLTFSSNSQPTNTFPIQSPLSRHGV